MDAWTCDCEFLNAMMLPCSHILNVVCSMEIYTGQHSKNIYHLLVYSAKDLVDEFNLYWVKEMDLSLNPQLKSIMNSTKKN